MRHHSTLTCLLTNNDDWYSGLDLVQPVGLVFIYLEKFLILLTVICSVKNFKFMAFRGESCLGFRSSLSNRKKFCRVNDDASDIQGVEVGVPHGSCLGPLLLIIYINDLPLAVQGSTISMYADDTSLCHQSLNMAQLNKTINNDLRQLSTWLQANKLSLNVAKTHSMLIATKQKQDGLNSTNQKLELNI